MTRVKVGSVARKRRKKILKAAKGYFGSKHRLFKTAKEQLMRSYVYAYRDRKQNKRNFRKLWITRINAACRDNDISYSKFINGLNKAGLLINRKMLSEIAIDSPQSFTDLVVIAKDSLAGKTYEPPNIKLEEKEKPEPKKKVAKKEVVKEDAEPKPVTTKKAPATTKKVTPAIKKSPAKKAATAPKKVTTKKATATIKKSPTKKIIEKPDIKK